MLAPLLYGRPSEKVEPKSLSFGNFLSLENQPYPIPLGLIL